MTNAAIKLGFFALTMSTVGCSFMMRSPEDYRLATRTVLEERQPTVKACYDVALKADPAAKGTVAVKFIVEKETGKLLTPEVAPDQTTAPAALSQCVVDSLNGLVLDPPDKREGHATFVWDFQPGGAPVATEAPAPAPAG